MAKAKETNSRGSVKVALSEGIDGDTWARICRDIGGMEPEAFNCPVKRLEDHVFLDDDGGGKVKPRGILNSCPAGLEELKACLEKVSMSEMTVALLVNELLCQTNGNFANDILNMFQDRIRKITASEREELMGGENDMYMFGVLQGLELAGQLQ